MSNGDGDPTVSTNCCCLPGIETSIIINGSQSDIWNIMMDGPGHDEWDPFMNSCTYTINSKPGDKI